MNEIADVIDRAADLLWVRGRCRDGQTFRDDGRMCVRGAILEAAGSESRDWVLRHDDVVAVAASRELRRYISAHPELLGVDLDGIWGPFIERGDFPDWVWNDRTEDDDVVIDTLRACAKELRA